MQQSDVDQFRTLEVPAQKLFINGKWVEGCGKPFVTTSPINGHKLALISTANSQDVDDAVQAARISFDSGIWSRSPLGFRKKVMLKIADLLQEHALELAVLGARDNGTEIGMAVKAEPGSAAGTFRYYAEAIDKLYGEVSPSDPGFLGMILREPIGVVGAILPWNFPLMIGAWKIASALAVGNSIVLKPSEIASLSLLRLGAIAQEAGLPDGVLNIVTGDGTETGSAMAYHMDIDALGFTGSGRTGRALMQAAAASNMKRLFLELGGKSPNVIFSDTEDLQGAAKVSAAGIFRNSGQVCIAGSRLLVERSVLSKFTDAMIAESIRLKIGDPLDMKNDIGAVACEQQLARDMSFASSAAKQGATLASGGHRILENTGGYYMQPTVFTDVTSDMEIFQKEVFGPVLTITPFDSEEEAVSLANDSELGLASAVWTSNLSRAHRMINNLRAGVVHVNTYGGANNAVPLGGIKQSGNGADKSLHALEKYSVLKTAWIKL